MSSDSNERQADNTAAAASLTSSVTSSSSSSSSSHFIEGDSSSSQQQHATAGGAGTEESAVMEEGASRDGPPFHRRQVSLSDEASHDDDDEFYHDDDDDDESALSYYEEDTMLSFDSQEETYCDDETEQESIMTPQLQEYEEDFLERQRSSVIAIGIPAPDKDDEDVDESKYEEEEEQQEEDTKRPPRFKTPHEINQEAVSEAVALGMAETEHDRKHKDKDASRHTMVARTKRLSSKVAKSASPQEKQHQQDDVDGKRASLYRLEHVIQSKQDEREKPNRMTANESIIYGTRRNRDSLIGDDQDDEEEEEDDLEAQAGIPVVMPGAFAMEGMDAQPGRQVTGYDSGFDNSDSESEDMEQARLPSRQPEAPPMVELEGELHQEPQLVDGLALMEDEVPPEEVKVPLKIRFLQASMFVGSLAAIGLIIGLGVGLSNGSSNSSRTTSTSDDTLIGWEVVGEPLRATQPDKDGSFFGSAVSFTADGSRLAVASPGWDASPGQLDVGQALVYDWNGGNWELVGQELIGPGPRTTTGGSLSLLQTVALSKDGSRVAFGSPDWNGGQVAVLQEPSAAEAAKWTLVGQNLTGTEGENGRFGYSVAMSSTGAALAVGAPFAANNKDTAAGVVRVFRETASSTWSQLGQDLIGEGSYELNGFSVALSSDGSHLVTGSPGSGIIGNFTGAVRVYRLDGTVWTQLGRTIRGDSIQDRFGHSVSVSDDGSILAVGGWEKPDPTTGGIFVGHVRIYKYVETSNDWEQLGSDLVGSASYDDFGYSVALSADGRMIAVGSPRTNSISGGSAPRGRIDIFDFDGSEWQKQGGTISGTQDFDNLGHSVAISADASRVAGGAPASGFDGKYTNVGKVAIVEPADG